MLLLPLMMPVLGFFGGWWDPIEIGWDPRIAEFGPFELTWHGVFTAVGIAAGVYLGVMLARRQGFTEDDGYAIALVGVPAGIIGARGMWLIENRDRIHSFGFVFKVNEGGITVMGGIILAIIACVVYGAFRRMPITRGLDVSIFGALLGMAIGRIGDIVNGEHFAKWSNQPWAVVYTNPRSPSYLDWPACGRPGIGDRCGVYEKPFAFPHQHPAVAYEMIGDLLIILVLWFIFTRIWRHRPGITFFLGVVLYSAMRFGVSYLRLDSKYVIKDWMTFPQVVAMCTFAIGVVGLAWALRRAPQEAPQEAPATPPPAARRAAARRGA